MNIGLLHTILLMMVKFYGTAANILLLVKTS